jgi:hypothetical protein
MKIEIDIPEYRVGEGMKTPWEENFILHVRITEEGSVHLLGNREGLISLARHLLILSQASVPIHYHLHYDKWNSLEDDSVELIVERL